MARAHGRAGIRHQADRLTEEIPGFQRLFLARAAEVACGDGAEQILQRRRIAPARPGWSSVMKFGVYPVLQLSRVPFTPYFSSALYRANH